MYCAQHTLVPVNGQVQWLFITNRGHQFLKPVVREEQLNSPGMQYLWRWHITIDKCDVSNGLITHEAIDGHLLIQAWLLLVIYDVVIKLCANDAHVSLICGAENSANSNISLLPISQCLDFFDGLRDRLAQDALPLTRNKDIILDPDTAKITECIQFVVGNEIGVFAL